MQFDSPDYYATTCPADDYGSCPRQPTAQAVVDHLLAEHDPRLIATLLVREAYTNRRMTTVIDGLDMAVEREINALIPDPLSDDTPMEIVLGTQIGNQR